MNASKPAPGGKDETLQKILDTRPRGPLKRWVLWLAVLLGAVAAVGLLFYLFGERAPITRYRTEPAVVGTLVVTVSATGNLQPTIQVEVGSELSGIVDQVFVDVNDQVKQGQVLARLDLAKLQDAVTKARANLAAAEAQVLQAQATVAEARAALTRLKQVAQLSGGKVPSRSEMDTAGANLKRAQANEASARASVGQAKAELQSGQTDVAKASIRSPIDGVVLTRQVDPGQTVAASFQAPVLFTLAEDLSKMELQVDVDEADVGQVKEGQKATFSVDAWPGRRYHAVVTRVSYGSQVKEGVVSYQTVLGVNNSDLSLRPGMTGTAEITTLIRENALLVPVAALRFTPPAKEEATQRQSRSLLNMMMPRPPRQVPKAFPPGGNPRVWVLRDGQPVAIEVRTGASNGRQTEIIGGPLEAGTQVITEALDTQQ